MKNYTNIKHKFFLPPMPKSSSPAWTTKARPVMSLISFLSRVISLSKSLTSVISSSGLSMLPRSPTCLEDSSCGFPCDFYEKEIALFIPICFQKCAFLHFEKNNKYPLLIFHFWLLCRWHLRHKWLHMHGGYLVAHYI